MRKVLTAVMIVAAALYAADPAREQTLQRAIDLMESKGDLAKAMPLFEDVSRSADKALAARALLYLGQGQERQGAEKARTTYERIIKEFGTQTETVAAARTRLAAIGTASPAETLTKRLVCNNCDSDADFSPDGRSMVMTDWNTGDLALREMSTGQIKRLMAKTSSLQDSNVYAEFPLFSPDLRHIVYHWETGEKGSSAQLRVVANEPGSKVRVLVNTPENVYYEPAAWSPDGKSVLVLIEKPDLTWQLAWVSVADGSVKVLKSLEWRMRWGGRQARALQNVRSHPRISPDGRYIVYAALATNPKTATGPIGVTDKRIYVLAADGSSEAELVKTAGINDNPTLTPDGKHLLFTSDRSGTVDLWSIAVENGRAAGLPVHVMGAPGTEIRALRMTRSGSYYYTNSGRGVETISIAEPGKPAGAAENLVGIIPSWSPDGKQLASFRHRPSAGEGIYDLVVHSLDTGDERLYSFNGMSPAPLRWFHDGKGVIVVVQNPGKTRGLYRIDLASKEFRQILEVDGSAIEARVVGPLSPDEQTIYAAGYAPGKGGGVVDRIVAIDLQTRQQKQVSPLPATTGMVNIVLSPDGRTLSIRYLDPETRRTHVARVGIDGSAYQEIYTGDVGSRVGHFAWTNDGRGILFGVPQFNKWKIVRISAEGGNPEATDFYVGNGILQNFSLSPDGKRLAFSTMKQVQELWSVDNILSVVK